MDGDHHRQGKAAAGRGRAHRLVIKAEAKDITFDTTSRRKMAGGIQKLASAVGCTMGPRGRNVVLEQEFGMPQVINDGVTIARAIDLSDPVENAGAQLIKEVAGRTNDSAGDGTTTASVLANALIQLGLQQVESGSNPINIKKGMDKVCAHIVAQLKEKAKPVTDSKDIKVRAGGSPPDPGRRPGRPPAPRIPVPPSRPRAGDECVFSHVSLRGLGRSTVTTQTYAWLSDAPTAPPLTAARGPRPGPPPQRRLTRAPVFPFPPLPRRRWPASRPATMTPSAR